MKFRQKQATIGFTVVELLVVIVVVGILATLTIVTYNGVQKSAAYSAMKSDLSGGARIMEVSRRAQGSYPLIPPAELGGDSSDTTFKLVAAEGPPRYIMTNPTQQAVLFHTLCQGLVTEGFGTGTNQGGGVERYITGCNIYNHDKIQINGWQSHNFSTPLTSSTLSAYAASVPPGDSWRPDRQAVVRAFYNELATRYTQSGGGYPIENFWDPWAAPGNGGIPKEPLPAPSAPGPDGLTYCLEARHPRYTDLVASIKSTEPTVKEVSCDP